MLEVWKKEITAVVFDSEISGVLNWAAFGGEVAGFLDGTDQVYVLPMPVSRQIATRCLVSSSPSQGQGLNIVSAGFSPHILPYDLSATLICHRGPIQP